MCLVWEQPFQNETTQGSFVASTLHHLSTSGFGPQVVKRIFMMFVDTRRFFWWKIQHHRSFLEAVMTGQDKIHKSEAGGGEAHEQRGKKINTKGRLDVFIQRTWEVVHEL